MSTEFINDQWRLPNAWNGSESNVNKQSNYSMDFDGSSQYVDASNLSVTGDWSVSLWVNSNSTSYQTAVQLANSTTTGTNDSLIFLYLHPGGASANWGFYDGSSTLIGSALNTGQWYNLIVTKSGTTYTLFLNGTQENQNTKANINIEDLLIGKRSANIFYMDGKIDGVSIYNYALSSSQVTTLYGSSSTGIGNPMAISGGGKPVAYYNLGDKSAFNNSNYLIPNSSLKDYVFSFNGSNDITVSYSSSLDQSVYSFSFWVNNDLNSGVSNDGIITADSSTRGWSILQDNQTLKFNPNISGGSGQIDITNFFNTTSTWIHCAITFDGTDLIVYKNGTSVGSSSSGTRNLNSNNNPLTIGNNTFASGRFFNGKMSNVQIFNTALPATGSNSVETLYNNGSPLTSMSGFTSLQGWWKLDASATYDSSTTTWTIPDDSTNSNDGTSSGMTQANLVQSDLSFTSGYSPYALDFDSASSDYIDCGNDSSLNLTTGLTVSTWVKLTAYQNDKFILAKRWASNSFQIATAGGGKSQCSVWVGSTRYDAIGSTVLSADTWYNIVGTFDGSNVKVYVNSTLEDTTPASGNLATTTDILSIAKGLNNDSYNFNGSISNASIWNAALTSAQVTELYNEGVPSNLNNHSAYSNLVSWWQLGSNSSFNSTLNQWTCIDEKGTNTGESSQTFNEDAIVDGVGSYANGLSSGMGGDEVIGDAPYSTANSLSVNMDVEDRTTDTPS